MRDAGQLPVIEGSYPPPPLNDIRKLPELDDPHGCLHVGHPVVIPDLRVGLDYDLFCGMPFHIRYGHTVMTEPPQPGCGLGVVRGYHTSFAGGYNLPRMKTETGGIAVSAYPPALVLRADGACRVPYEDQSPFSAQIHYRIQVGRHAPPGKRRHGL